MKTSAPIQYRQYILSTVSILLVSVLCFTVRDSINYKATALILLFTVSIIAMLFDILPVLLSAFLSAVIWNFFFISPQFTLDISDTEDLLMFLSYFVIALLNAVLTFKIRQAERKARDKEEKEQTIKLYNTLLNSLSHELRTPIATILGTVDILKEACHNHKLNFSQQMDLLNDIDIATVRLNRQVKNILNLNRIESGILKPKADWCDINELINSILQKIEITEGHEIYFTSNENLPLFKLDIGFTEQILLNIIHNAVQYTPKNSIIKIDVNYELKSCKIVISDNGNGIPESEHVLIFDKFKRLPDSKTRGTGLGLSIVKGFAEAQGGTVTLENNIPHGSIFTIQIPAETSYINHLKNE